MLLAARKSRKAVVVPYINRLFVAQQCGNHHASARYGLIFCPYEIAAFRVDGSIASLPGVARKRRGQPRALGCSRLAAAPNPLRHRILLHRRRISIPDARIHLIRPTSAALRPLLKHDCMFLRDCFSTPTLRRRRYVPEPGVGCVFCILPRVGIHDGIYPNGGCV
jgi:hypothetical protein